MELNLFALAIMFVGIGAGAFVKGLTGFGLPPVAVPIIAIFLGVETAVVVLTIPNLVSNAWLIWGQRAHLKTTRIRWDIFIPAAIAVIAGVWFLQAIDPRQTVQWLAFALGVFLIFNWLKPDYKLDGKMGRITVPLVAMVGGFSQGSTGMSGAIFSPLLLALRIEKGAFVLYSGILLGFFNVLQLITMVHLDMMTEERIHLGMIAVLPLFLFQHFGMRLTDRVSTKTFNRIVVATLIGVECKLIWEAVFQ